MMQLLYLSLIVGYFVYANKYSISFDIGLLIDVDSSYKPVNLEQIENVPDRFIHSKRSSKKKIKHHQKPKINYMDCGESFLLIIVYCKSLTYAPE